jgi:hypothetical protein
LLFAGKQHNSTIGFIFNECIYIVCRHGGFDTFNLDIAHQAVGRASRTFSPSTLQFLFLNTFPFMEESPSVHFLPSIVDMAEKEEFFSQCDVMLHARYDGESFGLAIAEMSVRNKPVMTFRPPSPSLAYTSHIRILGQKGFYYTSGKELDALIADFVVSGVESKDHNAYRDFSPEKVMTQFESTFIIPCLSTNTMENRSSVRFSHSCRESIFWMTLLSPGVLLFQHHHASKSSDQIQGAHWE